MASVARGRDSWVISTTAVNIFFVVTNDGQNRLVPQANLCRS